MAQQFGKLAGQRQQRVERDAGVDAAGFEHMHRVFGADVAGGAGGVGAAADAAERGVDAVDARLDRGEHIGEPHAARVVEMDGERHAGEGDARGRAELGHLPRVGHAGGVGEGQAVHAHRQVLLGGP